MTDDKGNVELWIREKVSLLIGAGEHSCCARRAASYFELISLTALFRAMRNFWYEFLFRVVLTGGGKQILRRMGFTGIWGKTSCIGVRVCV